MKTQRQLTPLEATFAEISDMDRCGFFTGNGTFGLEKRDALVEDLKKLEAEHAELVAVAEAAEKLEHRMKMWQRDIAEGVEVIHCRNGLEAALATLAAVRNSNK